ncbi:MAG: hypothetical protein A2Z14_12670 [Chloroflexi bacterium RBG_16_48_8]|nr:MAG: hypothetical protein A2Z14_12670 [Chloroflexi bacterium RBG_16_48_8]
MYGADAGILNEVAVPILERTPFMIGTPARLRFRPPRDGVREELLKIKPQKISLAWLRMYEQMEARVGILMMTTVSAFLDTLKLHEK